MLGRARRPAQRGRVCQGPHVRLQWDGPHVGSRLPRRIPLRRHEAARLVFYFTAVFFTAFFFTAFFFTAVCFTAVCITAVFSTAFFFTAARLLLRLSASPLIDHARMPLRRRGRGGGGDCAGTDTYACTRACTASLCRGTDITLHFTLHRPMTRAAPPPQAAPPRFTLSYFTLHRPMTRAAHFHISHFTGR